MLDGGWRERERERDGGGGGGGDPLEHCASVLHHAQQGLLPVKRACSRTSRAYHGLQIAYTVRDTSSILYYLIIITMQVFDLSALD